MNSLKTLLVNISPKSTTDPSKGHWHWAHSAFLSEAEKSFDEVLNFSSYRNENPLGLGILGGYYDEERVSTSTISEDAKNVLTALKEFSNYKITIHIYEGSVDSLILLGRIIAEINNSTGIVNLHWADRVFDSSQSRLFISTMKWFQAAFSSRIQIAAESEKLAKFLRQKGVQSVVEYPVFSVHQSSYLNKKKYDVLVTADDIPELNYFVQSAMNFHTVTGNFLKVAISLGSHLYPWPFGPELLKYLKSANIEVFTGGLSKDEYSELLGSSRAQILLYSSPFYVWGSSGRLLDGLQCQTKSIVPSNTALSDYVETNDAGWAVEISDIDKLTSLLVLLSSTSSEVLQSPHRSTQVDDCIKWVSQISKSNFCEPSFNKASMTVALWKLVSYQLYVGVKRRLGSKSRSQNDATLIQHQESLRLSHLQQMVTTLDEMKTIQEFI